MKLSTLYFILGVSQIAFGNVQSTNGNQGEYVIGIFICASSTDEKISSIESVLNRPEALLKGPPAKTGHATHAAAPKPTPKPTTKHTPKPGNAASKPGHQAKGPCPVGKGKLARRQCFRGGERESSSSGEDQAFEMQPKVRPKCDGVNAQGRGKYFVEHSRISDHEGAHDALIDCYQTTTCDTTRTLQWYMHAGAGHPQAALETCRRHCPC
jgi:hypothetical protein